MPTLNRYALEPYRDVVDGSSRLRILAIESHTFVDIINVLRTGKSRQTFADICLGIVNLGRRTIGRHDTLACVSIGI